MDKSAQRPRKSDHMTAKNAAGGYLLECQNCGATYQADTPCSFGMLKAQMNRFLRDHKNCKPKVAPGERA